jgi:hypothetical protein
MKMATLYQGTSLEAAEKLDWMRCSGRAAFQARV